ncbi:MAG: cytochrome P450 [Actinomycetota bacterium]
MLVEQVMYPALRQVVKRPRLADFLFGRDRWGNPFSQQAYADPHHVIELMRADGPVQYHRMYQQWFVFGYEEARQVLTFDGLTNTAQAELLLQVRPYSKLSPRAKTFLRTFLNLTDPPQHTRLRGLVSRAFTPARVRALEPRVGPIVDELLTGLEARDGFDVMEDVAIPLPVNVIGTLLGLPRDRWDWSRRTTDHVVQMVDPFHGFDPVAMNETIDDIFEFYGSLAEKRLAHPRDDLISALASVEEDGDRLTRDELVTMVFFMMAAGHETTTRLLGNSVLALARHPTQRALVRAEPDLWPNAVEELVRFDTSVRNVGRGTTRDLEVGGVTIPAGSTVVINLGAANRDPRRWERPNELVVDRDDPAPLSFAHGAHYCVGAALARMELRVALRALVDRMGDYTVDEDAITWNESLILRGPRRMTLRPG